MAISKRFPPVCGPWISSLFAGKIIFLLFCIVRSFPFSYCINRLFLCNSFYFDTRFRHYLKFQISLSLSLWSSPFLPTAKYLIFLQDRRARVETTRSTETATAAILVNKVNKNRALQLQTFTFIIVFSATFHVYIYYYFKRDILRKLRINILILNSTGYKYTITRTYLVI